MMEKLITQRLILSEVEESDSEDITRILQDPVIYMNTLNIPWPYTIADAESFILNSQARSKEGRTGWNFAIRLRENGRFIGVIGLSELDRHHCSEAGYWLDQNYRGQGYMTEALQEIIRFGFRNGCHRIEARHFTSNPASGRVMEKAGMCYEGTFRESLLKNDRYYDDRVYAILETDDIANNSSR